MYKAYLFDWDGCLADTLSIWLQAHRDIFAHFEIPFPEREDFEKVLADINFADGVQAKDPNYVADKYAEVHRQIGEIAEFNPGAVQLLNELKAQGCKLAIITSSERPQVELMLTRHNMLDVFDILVCAEDTLKHKPHPEPLIKAITELNAAKADVVMVGDTYYDINAGKALGIDTILYHHPGFHDKFYDLADQVETNPPTHIVANLTDILKL